MSCDSCVDIEKRVKVYKSIADQLYDKIVVKDKEISKLKKDIEIERKLCIEYQELYDMAKNE